jgi:hypothetical protein
MCLMKIILILALRSGNIHGTTTEEVLNYTQGHADRTVQWRRPDRLVLCGAEQKTHLLKWVILTHRLQTHRAIVRGSRLLGSSMKLSLHSLRFCAADDLLVVNPDGASTGLSLDKIADQLTHHQVARMKGVELIYTQAYSTGDHWAKRTQLQGQNLPFIASWQQPRRVFHRPSLGIRDLRQSRTQTEVNKDCEARCR